MSYTTKTFYLYGICINNLKEDILNKLTGITEEQINEFGYSEFQKKFEELAIKLPKYRGNTGIVIQVEDEFLIGYGETENVNHRFREASYSTFSEKWDSTQELASSLRIIFGDDAPILFYHGAIYV